MRLRARASCVLAAGLALALFASSAWAVEPSDNAPSTTRSGRDIYEDFREGLADPGCPSGGSPRWKQHFAAAPRRMASANDDVLPLFGYVVDAVREAHLPTEYALIPFVESGYRPGARSPSGPAGLWQFIGTTARNHDVPMRAGYDGRLSPVDSTRAAVRYLKTLHGMFAGDWRLAVMAYNAGEYRVLGSLRRAGQNARNAKPESLPGLSPITHAYVQKLRALSCLLEQADDRDEWMRALDRPVANLHPHALPKGATTLDAWARANDLDAAQVRRFNPAFADGRIVARKDNRALHVLAPTTDAVLVALDTSAKGSLAKGTQADASLGVDVGSAAVGSAIVGDAATIATPTQRTHTVAQGESLWTIARRYGVATSELIARNKLDKKAKLRPGMVLRIDADALPPDTAAGP